MDSLTNSSLYRNALVHSIVASIFALFVEVHLLLYAVSTTERIGKSLVAIFTWGILIWLLTFAGGLFVAREVVKYFAGKESLEGDSVSTN